MKTHVGLVIEYLMRDPIPSKVGEIRDVLIPAWSDGPCPCMQSYSLTLVAEEVDGILFWALELPENGKSDAMLAEREK